MNQCYGATLRSWLDGRAVFNTETVKSCVHRGRWELSEQGHMQFLAFGQLNKITG